MINLTINYQGRKVPLSIDVTGAVKIDEIASMAAEKLTTNFTRFMKNVHNTELTDKSRQKYFISQYVIIKLKLQEML